MGTNKSKKLIEICESVSEQRVGTGNGKRARISRTLETMIRDVNILGKRARKKYYKSKWYTGSSVDDMMLWAMVVGFKVSGVFDSKHEEMKEIIDDLIDFSIEINKFLDIESCRDMDDIINFIFEGCINGGLDTSNFINEVEDKMDEMELEIESDREMAKTLHGRSKLRDKHEYS